MSFHSITEIENICATIEQLNNVLSLLQERYFDDLLTDETAIYLFANGKECMQNIITLVNTQLFNVSHRLEEIADYECQLLQSKQ